MGVEEVVERGRVGRQRVEVLRRRVVHLVVAVRELVVVLLRGGTLQCHDVVAPDPAGVVGPALQRRDGVGLALGTGLLLADARMPCRFWASVWCPSGLVQLRGCGVHAAGSGCRGVWAGGMCRRRERGAALLGLVLMSCCRRLATRSAHLGGTGAGRGRGSGAVAGGVVRGAGYGTLSAIGQFALWWSLPWGVGWQRGSPSDAPARTAWLNVAGSALLAVVVAGMAFGLHVFDFRQPD